MLRMKAKLLIGVLLTLPLLSICQNWKALFQAKGPSTVLSRGVEIGPNNEIYWIGIFEQQVQIGPDTLYSAGSADIFLSKLDQFGHPEWSLRFGGKDLDRVMSTTVDNSGNIYLTGGFSDEVIFGGDTLYSPDRDVFVAKYDTVGKAVWAVSLSGNQSDFGQGIAVDASGHVYLTGVFMSDSLSIGSVTLQKQGSSDMFLIKLDSFGNALWGRQGGAASTTLGNSVALDSTGNIYLTGSFQDSASFSGQWVYSQGRSDAYVAQYTPSGNLNWIRPIQGAGFDAGQALAGTEDGVLVTGRYSDVLSLDTFSLAHAGSYDIFLADYNSNGQVMWAKAIGGSSREGSYGLDYRQHVGIYLAGEFSSQLSFDQQSLTSQGSTDAFLAKYDDFGTNRWVLSAGGMNKEQAYAAFSTHNQHVYFAGHFRDWAMFDSTTLTSGGRDDAFLAYIHDQDSIPPPPLTNLPLQGRIFEDSQINCVADSQEMGYRNWFVTAEPGYYYGLSDARGEFMMDVPAATYKVYTHIPYDQASWLYSNCPPVQIANTGAVGPTQNSRLLPFGQVEKAEAQLQLSIDATDFVRCQPGQMVLDYENTGAAPAQDVSIDLQLPEEVSIRQSSVPFRSLSRGKYLFLLPDIPPQREAQVDIQFLTSCNPLDRTGKNISIRGEIHSPSVLQKKDIRWNGAEVTVSGQCINGDEVLFIFKNTSTADLQDSVEVRYYADDVFCHRSRLWLASGDSLGYLMPSSGKTIRCELQQAAFHPRNAWVQASVEACTANRNAPVSLGFQQHFSPADASSPAAFRLNRQLQDTLPGIVWQVSPTGRGRYHKIDRDERLFFHISFQAPAHQSLKAFQIIDTLSSWLDPASMRWETHSHQFDVAVHGQGTPALHFSMVHDSLAPGESGFLSFSLKFKARIPEGTQIRQRAWTKADSFSWKPTPWVFHTIQKDELDQSCTLPLSQYDFSTQMTTSLADNLTDEVAFISPNPFSDHLLFRFADPNQVQAIQLFDLSGNLLLRTETEQKEVTQLEVSILASGIYFAHIHTQTGNRVIKVIKQ